MIEFKKPLEIFRVNADATFELGKGVDPLVALGELSKAFMRQQSRIKRLEHEIELFREHADYGDKCLIEAILKGEAIGRKAKESKPCIYCMKVECVCSDFDISSNMGAQG